MKQYKDYNNITNMNNQSSGSSLKVKHKCSDCHSTTNLQVCRCSSKHYLCQTCVKKSNDRADRENFYKVYRGWCDTCIWFDIG